MPFQKQKVSIYSFDVDPDFGKFTLSYMLVTKCKLINLSARGKKKEKEKKYAAKHVGNCTSVVANVVHSYHNKILKVFRSWCSSTQYFEYRIAAEIFCVSL